MFHLAPMRGISCASSRFHWEKRATYQFSIRSFQPLKHCNTGCLILKAVTNQNFQMIFFDLLVYADLLKGGILGSRIPDIISRNSGRLS